jgi:NAD(P)-dependent dehydrogenase (short-subunit alcohol dehydrogenase family)
LTKIESSLHRPLTGQVAVITGAGRGIGQAVALKLAALGAHTVLCGRSRAALEQTSAAIQSAIPPATPASSAPTSTPAKGAATRGAAHENRADCTVMECDITDLRSVEALAGQIERAFRRVDILVNNAGISGVEGPLHRLAPENWDSILNTNLRGAYYCIRSFAPLMIEAGSGHIINISSLAGKNALPNGAAYAASKWGLNGLTYSVAEELRAHNIRVSVICPGSVHTDFSPHAGKNAEKMLQGADVAHVVAMLVTQSPQSFASEVLLRPTQKP